MKMKFLFLWLIMTLATVNAIIYFSTEEMEDAVVALPSIKVDELLPEETIVTGVCTFGDCPVATAAPETTEAETSQDLAETSQARAAEEYSSAPSQVTANSQLLTETETEAPEEVTEPIATELEETPETEPKEEPETEPERSGRTVTCWVTAYCGCYECSEGYGNMTATGRTARPNHTIAVDPRVIPYGTQVEINGIVYTAEDCGGGINGYMIDIYFEEHWQCYSWSTGYYDVTIY